MTVIAMYYMDLVARGRSDPAVEIARHFGLTPTTARSWIHRARKAGLLGAAVGRTAGTAVEYTSALMSARRNLHALTKDLDEAMTRLHQAHADGAPQQEIERLAEDLELTKRAQRSAAYDAISVEREEREEALGGEET